MKSLNQTDPEIARAIEQEAERQTNRLVLIASENYASPAVMEAQASVLTNKYAEGYPGNRYYGGCEYVDAVENLAISRAKILFGAEAANVQAHSGSQANMAVYFSVLKPGDGLLGMDLAHGGHLTHGSPVSFSGRFFKAFFYGVHPETHRIDFEEVRRIAQDCRPRLIVAGASAYPRLIDFARFAEIAREVGALLMVDMAHIAGLVAAGVHPSPVPYSDFVTSTTHKTLRGPRGGLILSRLEVARALDSQIFPGIQGGPLMHVIAAKAVCLKEAATAQFREYQNQVLKNARILAENLIEQGFKLISGGTDNHMILVDLSPGKLTGQEAEKALDEAGITVNKNRIPFDTLSSKVTSGIRLGTPALTTRGMKEKEMVTIGQWIGEVLKNPLDQRLKSRIREEVRTFCGKFPLFSSG
jgi:glycine hydroxymethyltransferase